MKTVDQSKVLKNRLFRFFGATRYKRYEHIFNIREELGNANLKDCAMKVYNIMFEMFIKNRLPHLRRPGDPVA